MCVHAAGKDSTAGIFKFLQIAHHGHSQLLVHLLNSAAQLPEQAGNLQGPQQITRMLLGTVIVAAVLVVPLRQQSLQS